jgi:hypothetical protein
MLELKLPSWHWQPDTLTYRQNLRVKNKKTGFTLLLYLFFNQVSSAFGSPSLVKKTSVVINLSSGYDLLILTISLNVSENEAAGVSDPLGRSR